MRLTRNIQIFCALLGTYFIWVFICYIIIRLGNIRSDFSITVTAAGIKVVYLSALLLLELFRCRCCKSSWYCSMEPSSCLEVNVCCCCEAFTSPSTFPALCFFCARFDSLILSRTRFPSRDATSTWLTLELFR